MWWPAFGIWIHEKTVCLRLFNHQYRPELRMGLPLELPMGCQSHPELRMGLPLEPPTDASLTRLGFFSFSYSFFTLKPRVASYPWTYFLGWLGQLTWNLARFLLFYEATISLTFSSTSLVDLVKQYGIFKGGNLVKREIFSKMGKKT